MSLLLSGCGSSSSSTAQQPASPATTPAGGGVVVDGFATADSGGLKPNVEIDFRDATTGGSVARAVSAADGKFSVSIAPGTYAVSCSSTIARCDVLTRDGIISQIVIAGPTSNVVLFVRDGGQSSSSAAPDVSVSGRVVLEDGSPAYPVNIEFQGFGSHPFAKDDRNGYYSITLPAGTYNALCVVVNEDYDCGVIGDHGIHPHPISVPPEGQTINFMVCKSADFPACLQQ